MNKMVLSISLGVTRQLSVEFRGHLGELSESCPPVCAKGMTPVTHLWFSIWKLLTGNSLLHFALSSSAYSENLTYVPLSASKLGEGWGRAKDALKHTKDL